MAFGAWMACDMTLSVSPTYPGIVVGGAPERKRTEKVMKTILTSRMACSFVAYAVSAAEK
jgi:hypothetical protein